MNFYKYAMSLVVAGAMMIAAVPCTAQQPVGMPGQELEFNLFQNQYTPQGNSLTTAGMYNAPHPVPYWVGGSHYTYQPFYPHQHLYQHRKNYYNYYGTADQFYSDNQKCGAGGDAMNKTTVVWKGTGYHFGNLPFSSHLAQKACYNIYSRKYGLNSARHGGGHGLGGHCKGGHCGHGCQNGNCGNGHCQ